MRKVIINGKIIMDDLILENKVIVFDEKIISIDDKNKVDFEGMEIIDAEGDYVSPGFVDIHTHGCGGFDTMNGTEESIEGIRRIVLKSGVTSFLPTTMTEEPLKIEKALENVRKAMKRDANGANILGIHLEGPFINTKKKGAQRADCVLPAEMKLIENYMDIVKIITIAPEVNENIQFIEKISKEFDIVFSIGHTDATYEEAVEAIRCGVKSATHLFNAMTGLHHRNPGVVGAVFNSDIYCELIGDKIHVHPSLFELLLNIKGKERIVLITDSMEAACLKKGDYQLGGQKVIVDETSARLEDGTLAGSILRLNEAVRNMVENTSYSLPQVVNLASLNPATLIGVNHRKGSLHIGKDADIVIFDKNINVSKTIVGGKLIYLV